MVRNPPRKGDARRRHCVECVSLSRTQEPSLPCCRPSRGLQARTPPRLRSTHSLPSVASHVRQSTASSIWAATTITCRSQSHHHALCAYPSSCFQSTGPSILLCTSPPRPVLPRRHPHTSPPPPTHPRCSDARVREENGSPPTVNGQ